MSLVVQFNRDTRIDDMARGMLEQLVRSPIDSAHSIKVPLELDKPLGNHTCLNITRPVVL